MSLLGRRGAILLSVYQEGISRGTGLRLFVIIFVYQRHAKKRSKSTLENFILNVTIVVVFIGNILFEKHYHSIII